MAPRRPRAGSSVGNGRPKGTPRKTGGGAGDPTTAGASPSLANASPNLTMGVPATPGMSDAARYEQNLKVLRIRDKTIVKIIDQFSHVCLYDHNGTKWEKRGFEGSMFLVERETEPRYGYYILNREGPQDVNEPMYPEDDLEMHGQYLMYRTYPEYTAARLARIRENGGVDPLASQSPDPYADKKSTPSKTIGLWMFQSGRRESLADVMVRLHGYIVKGLPYPEEYHHGLSGGRHPMASLNVTQSRSVSTPSSAFIAASQPHPQPPAHSMPQQISELDALFSKLGSNGPISPATARHGPTPSASNLPHAKQLSVANLFNAVNSGEVHPPSSLPYNAPPGNRGPTARVSSQHEIPGNISTTPSDSTPVRGLALLDSIFASASAASPGLEPSAVPPPYQHDGEMNASFRFPRTGPDLQHSSPYPPIGNYPSFNHGTGLTHSQAEIHSPKPVNPALPEVLSFDQVPVTPQDGSFAAFSSAPPSKSRNGQGYVTGSSYRSRQTGHRYEGDIENGISDMASEGSTIFDEEAIDALESNSYPAAGLAPPVAGPTDLTPRPPLKGFTSTTPPSHSAITLNPVSSSSSIATVTTRAAPATTLIDSSELWPAGGPLDDRSSEVEDEVLELDFADTSALGDPSIFAPESPRTKRKGKKGKKDKALPPASPPVQSTPLASGPGKGKGKGKQSATPPLSPGRNAKPLNGKQAGGVGKHVNGAPSTEIQPDVVRSSLLYVLFQQQPSIPPSLSKNDFVREVLTLIHTDKTFGEKLYSEYVARA